MLQCANRILQNTEDAEEAVQNAYVSLWLNIKETEYSESLYQEKYTKQYLYRIVKNAALKMVQERNKQAYIELDEEISSEIVSTINLEEDYAKKELYRAIMADIQNMDSAYREVLLLYYARNMTLKTVADYLDRPLTTVKSQ